MNSTAIPIWVPLAIACGISVWAVLSVVASERQRRQSSQPMQIASPSPPINAPNAAKPVAKTDDAKKPGRAAA